jgi:hypothetical protein
LVSLSTINISYSLTTITGINRASGLKRGGHTIVTGISSKDYTKMLEDLSKIPGCYAMQTIEGFGEWLDQWAANGGAGDSLNGTYMIVDQQTRKFSLWIEEVFKYER